MPELAPQWQLPPTDFYPPAWLQSLQATCPDSSNLPLQYAAQLLWQRGLRQPTQLRGFLNPNDYSPASAFEFGQEMEQAVARLIRASGIANPAAEPEKVAIWGDFDADGVTATAVLWEGLKPLFPPHSHLRYYIPNRFTESHGLSRSGLEQLAAWGCRLVVTCDTGSTHLGEIEYANQLGMDVIVTDHHTLPEQRPAVVAIINPRALPSDHPLSTLSGVAVAFKLLEALYQSLPKPAGKAEPALVLEELLDLVAIGLIADLVELTGDCRYLAQRGLIELQGHLQPGQMPRRPGIAELLTLCRRTGDRPTDISFGIGPRINAISRIHGDASFCVELLTSQDRDRCKTLALESELANSRRKALQREVLQQVKAKVTQIDLATTEVIVLSDEQWPSGILGLVAGQVAQEYGRPVILLSLDPLRPAFSETGVGTEGSERLARGSARSVPGIDLYELFKAQAHLLRSYGGHPLAAGLSLPAENLAVFAAALNRQVREIKGEQPGATGPVLAVDLVVSVADLGQPLFRALKLLEPYGMGNPVPRLMIPNCWVTQAWHRRIKDQRGGQVAYIRTEFKLWDDTVQTGFLGEWWDHYADDLPQGRCDVVVELDFNTVQKQYLVRLIAIRPSSSVAGSGLKSGGSEGLDPSSGAIATRRQDPILDWRQEPQTAAKNTLVITQCPAGWSEWSAWLKQAEAAQQPLAIAYPPPSQEPPQKIWTQLVGLAKYLSRTEETVSLERLRLRLGISETALRLGLRGLESLGFAVHWQGLSTREKGSPQTLTPKDLTPEDLTPKDLTPKMQSLQITPPPAMSTPQGPPPAAVTAFLDALQEEQFRRRYFYQIPVATLAALG